MARRRNTPSEKTEPDGFSMPPAAETETSPDAASTAQPITRQRKPRIIVKFSPDGKPDLSALDSGERAQLESAFHAVAPQEKTDPALVGMVVSGIAGLEAAVLSSRFGLDASECRRALGPHEPVSSALNAAAARVIDKHNLTGRYGDEIALAALLVSWQAGALQQIRALAAIKKEEEKRVKENAARGSVGQTPTRQEHSGLVVDAGEPA